MKTSKLVLAFMLSLGLHGTAQAAESKAASKPRVAYTELKVPAPSLRGNLLGIADQQGITVYLPPGYAKDTAKRYPVVYFLPGYGDSQLGYGMALADAMEALLAEGKTQEMIAVSLEGNYRYGGSFYVNSPVSGNWQDFVTKDVVGYVDKHYRTIPRAYARGLGGHSMGGFGVLHLGLNTSGVFGALYSMSPGVYKPGDLDRTPLSFSTTRYAEDFYGKLKPADYLERISGISWPGNFSYVYAFAFAYRNDGKPPFFHTPAENKDGEVRRDAIWQRYDAGYGGWEAKLDQHGANLKALKGFVIDYGNHDEFAWIVDGSKYLSAELKQRGIRHQLVEYDGDHQSKVYGRLKSDVLPFFSRTLAAE
ncbi:esterase [Chitiniphilus shinanonensis]|uniref:Esterase n=1 Tax=Chitiniphilus shinanonensis TaxID=553088 RepID=A0ABQ6BX28_9NEIS|nr:alpha/beta hydrolase-fold protein [Chitiniphilus shinanonensis]GLS06269.1 esterase [Chitiniphilus shinanonensis]